LEGEGEGKENRGGLGWGEVASDLKKAVKKLDGVGRSAIQ
jgi:hypothetical protein